ncbi:MAG: phosphotriesterase-related protein [Frankiales bacterium]|nr:phosphotriesterase-related protein [Frankiales bacterium]
MIDKSQLRTVLGDVDIRALEAGGGMALIHEHLSCDLSAGFGPEYVLRDEGMVSDELAAARLAGVSLVVDVGNSGHLREPDFLRNLADKSGVHIVASAGHYREGFFPEGLEAMSAEAIAAGIVHEIEVGIDDTGIRAGAIGEVGMTEGRATALEEKVFAASAQAQAQTGVPLMTHTAQGVGWEQQVQMLRDGGADLDRVIIGHMDCLDDNSAHVGVVDSGAWLGFDRINSLRYQTDEVRAERLVQLLEAGFGHRVVLSTDTAMVTRLQAGGGAGYGAVVSEFLPMLRALGVTDEWIHTLSVTNNWRFLSGSGSGGDV